MKFHFFGFFLIIIVLGLDAGILRAQSAPQRPNILICVADDWGWPFAQSYGVKWLSTPGFDRVASDGALFLNAFVNSPSCTPSRGSVLTGRYPWTLEEGSSLYGTLPEKYPAYPDVLESAGYKTGFTGKGWGPGSISAGGRTRDPSGPAWNAKRAVPPTGSMSDIDYASNFEDFLESKNPDQPFCFWYGALEPHRGFVQNSGADLGGLNLEHVDIPKFWPESKIIRNEILDYAYEIQHMDSHLVRMLDYLESIGELDNTVVIVTGDHGMPFPRAKVNLYEWGIHVPLAVRWGDRISGGKVVHDIVSLIDIAPTVLEASGIEAPSEMKIHGHSLLDLLTGETSGLSSPSREFAVVGIERHEPDNDHDSGGYPSRGLRTAQFLYIRNFEPDWIPPSPNISPTRSFLKSLEADPDPEMRAFFDLNFGIRPHEELFDIVADSECLTNLATNPAYSGDLEFLRDSLIVKLQEHRDPRILGYGEIFFSYPYFNNSRPDLRLPNQYWLDVVNEKLSGDGNSNGRADLIDHFLGDDLSDSSTFEATKQDASVVFQYSRTPINASETVLWSKNLKDWHAAIPSTIVLEHADGYEVLQVELPASADDSMLFFRLDVEFRHSSL